MKRYTFAHVLREKGFTALPAESYKSVHNAKALWVKQYLEPAVVKANCGWGSVKYVVMQHPTIGTEEYVVLASDAECPMDGRYIEVTASSNGAIFCSVADNLW